MLQWTSTRHCRSTFSKKNSFQDCSKGHKVWRLFRLLVLNNFSCILQYIWKHFDSNISPNMGNMPLHPEFCYSLVVVSASEAAYWCRKWTASVVANLYYYPRTLTRFWRVYYKFESRISSIFQCESRQEDVGKSSFCFKALYVTYLRAMWTTC